MGPGGRVEWREAEIDADSVAMVVMGVVGMAVASCTKTLDPIARATTPRVRRCLASTGILLF